MGSSLALKWEMVHAGLIRRSMFEFSDRTIKGTSTAALKDMAFTFACFQFQKKDGAVGKASSTGKTKELSAGRPGDIMTADCSC